MVQPDAPNVNQELPVPPAVCCILIVAILLVPRSLIPRGQASIAQHVVIRIKKSPQFFGGDFYRGIKINYLIVFTL